MNLQLVEKYGDRISSHSVEVRVDQTSPRTFYLPDDSILRGKQILEVFTRDNPNDNIVSPTGRNMVNDTILDNSYLTLVCGNKRFWDDHPLTDLVSERNDGLHRQLYAPNFNPSKSSITVAGSTALTAGESFLLHFTYID